MGQREPEQPPATSPVWLQEARKGSYAADAIKATQEGGTGFHALQLGPSVYRSASMRRS